MSAGSAISRRTDQKAAQLRRGMLACAIQYGSGAPSRCRPPATAADHATSAPNSVAAAYENARMIVLRRERAIAVFESAIA